MDDRRIKTHYKQLGLCVKMQPISTTNVIVPMVALLAIAVAGYVYMRQPSPSGNDDD